MNPYTGEVHDLADFVPDYVKEAFLEIEARAQAEAAEVWAHRNDAELARLAEEQGFVPVPPGTPEAEEAAALLASGGSHVDLSGTTPLASWARRQRNQKAKNRACRKAARAQHQRERRR